MKIFFTGDEDEEDVDMKSHGSVITHLLSQVRIGMDLTKIVLPTFILERRSLLEMYSDFFAHPDLFVQTTDGATPEERFINVLKWYLSSFHAGRKSRFVPFFVCISFGMVVTLSLINKQP